MTFFTRLSAGWNLALKSFAVLRQHKQLVLLPIISSLTLLLVMAGFAIGVFGTTGFDLEKLDQNSRVVYYIILFCYYVASYFVIVFFNMALIHCARLHFENKPVRAADGLRFSLSKIGVIFSWALFAGTVGLILKIIQDNAGRIGQIIIGMIGVVWSIATFFVVPVIAYENLGPIDAFKRSASLMKQKWGESLGATFSFGIIQFIALFIVGAILFILGSLVSPILGIILAVLGCFLIFAIISAAETIFISAVYHYTQGGAPMESFDNETLDGLFVHK